MSKTTIASFFAVLALGLFAIGCETTPAQEGAVAGGALGAGAGAIIGHQSGHAGEGALIGGAAGALGGALIGDKIDENRERRSGTVYRSEPAERVVPGHYETRVVVTESGERYEERVWVPHR